MTRWNSEYYMLESIADTFDDVYNILIQKKLLELAGNLDKNIEIIRYLIKILQPFKNATEMLENDEVPMLHMVIPIYFSLIKILDDIYIKTPSKNRQFILIVEYFKTEGKELLLEKYYSKIGILHKITSFLDPTQKKLPYFKRIEFEQVIVEVKIMLNELEKEYPNAFKEPNLNENALLQAPAPAPAIHGNE